MINFNPAPLTKKQRLVKRVFDLIASIFMLILSLPLMILAAIAIRIDSPGPILLKQKRVGENGNLFGMYKYRSMVQEAMNQVENPGQNNGNQTHKLPEDPRTTRVGRLLRRSSLDELPQLFNVIRGEMSLVGPRPELPIFVDQYQPWQKERLTCPQGMTGWWQINGRNLQPMYRYTEYDLYYIQHYSFWLDITIFLKTIWVVICGKGAF